MLAEILQWTALAIVLLLLYYTASTWKPMYFKKLGIPGPFPYPLVGNIFEVLRKGFVKFDVEAIRKYGKIIGLVEFGQPVLIVAELDMIRDIMTKEFSTFPNRRILNFDELTSKMLTMLRDDEWRNARHLLTPTFSSRKLKDMTSQMNECSSLFARNLGVEADTNSVTDIRDVTGAFTMDVIASTAFGIKVDSQVDKNNEFLFHAKKAFQFNLLRPGMLLALFFPKLVPLMKIFNISFLPKKTINFFLGIIENVISGRKSDPNTKRTDFIQLMINAHREGNDINENGSNADQMKNGNGPNTDLIKNGSASGQAPHGHGFEKKGLTKMEIMANSLIFFLAGYETTAATMSYLLYNLALNPDCQAKLQAEVDSVLDGKEDIDYETANKLTYLEMCIMETLRVYPPATRTHRNTERDIDINGVHIAKGTTVIVPVYAIHHDAGVWPNPEKFDPERFNVENRAKHHPFQFLPFGAGPRQCIGMRLALLELKLAVARAMKSFSVVPCAETQIPLILRAASPLLQPAQGIKLKLMRRD